TQQGVDQVRRAAHALLRNPHTKSAAHAKSLRLVADQCVAPGDVNAHDVRLAAGRLELDGVRPVAKPARYTRRAECVRRLPGEQHHEEKAEPHCANWNRPHGRKSRTSPPRWSPTTAAVAASPP